MIHPVLLLLLIATNMGTRNLTIVKAKGKTKVAQYGQWDGYPTGQGQTIADFFKTVDLAKFKEQVEALGVYTEKDIEKAYKDAGHAGGDWVTMDISDKVKKTHPELSRDYGAGILELIHAGHVTKVNLSEAFKEDKTFCEYWYEIDLDNETISVNDGKKYTFKQWTRTGKMEALEKAESTNED